MLSQNTIRRSLFAALALGSLLFANVGRIDALTVTWSPATGPGTTVTDESDLFNIGPGTVVQAVDWTDSNSNGLTTATTTDVIVGGNTVSFVAKKGIPPFPREESDNNFDNVNEQTNVGTNFDHVLDGGGYGVSDAAEGPVTVPFTVLLPNKTYYLQVFMSLDLDAAGSNIHTLFSITDDNSTESVDLYTDYLVAGGGKFAIATIGTGPTDNSFNLVVDNTGTSLASIFLLNAHVLTIQTEAVPEPSTFVLAALGLAGLVLVAWRRRK